MNETALSSAQNYLLTQQTPEGYWWFTLEANESIGAGFIQLMHFVDEVDPETQRGLVARLIQEQRPDGSWGLFYQAPGDISLTIEAYFALRLAGHTPEEAALQRAREFILHHGGLTQGRIFTRIHLALFGLVPWSATPSMPVWLIFLPTWSRASIYEFSSWARASIVPLLLIMDKKPVHPLLFNLDELYQGENRFFSATVVPPKSTLGRFFVWLDQQLKKLDRLKYHPFKPLALRQCEQWTREHVARTVDIYPAMGYAALAMKALGYGPEDPTLQQAMAGLAQFRQEYVDTLSPFVRGTTGGRSRPPESTSPHPSLQGRGTQKIHQQCCISPLWDTPWAGLALLESGMAPDHPNLLQAARYMISKQITKFRGDWSHKNNQGIPGGWAFEFQNDYFPDVDDTIQAVLFLKQVGLPHAEKEKSIERALDWLLSMQSSNGGWAAFDRNNTASWVNHIPFSDHGACLDPPTPDVTGRMLELLSHFGYTPNHPVVQKACQFLWRCHEPNGSWRGRWGVNYIYGTWSVLQGLKAMGIQNERTTRALAWLQSVQNKDGGWGESCLSDQENRYVPLGKSTASQTAWAVMGLLTGGKNDPCAKGVEWLTKAQTTDGDWEEPYFTGTGFPGHFYIRYHGYRHYFPLLALGRLRGVRRVTSPSGE